MNSEEWSKLKEILYGRTWGCPVDEARILSNLAIACGEMAVWAGEREKVQWSCECTTASENVSVLDLAKLPPFPEARVDMAPPQRCEKCGKIITSCDCHCLED